MKDILTKSFYQKDTLKVAQKLLGCILVRKIGRKVWRARITEVEAYIGEDDLACHARVGRTKRTETMYGQAGHAYVYLIYGMYHCLNIVTEAENFPAAILIRAVEIEGVPKRETNGPGKLCRFLSIDRKLNGHDITRSEQLWIERSEHHTGEKVKKSKRIGIDYAQHCREYLWRFHL
jgi:DNA-3-methyladenine glycosylase